MKTNEDKTQQDQPCCDTSQSGACCSLGSGGGSKNLKTAIFIGVILLAGAVVARSLLTKNGETASQSAEVTSSFDTVGQPDNTGLSTESTATGEQTSETAAISYCTTLDSIKSLDTLAADKTAVFILLAGESEESTAKATGEIEQAVKTISTKGIQVGTYTMDKDTADYAWLVQKLSIKSFPAIVAMGKGCGAATVSGEITEAKLLGAFIKATTPVSCGPQGGSSCCPK